MLRTASKHGIEETSITAEERYKTTRGTLGAIAKFRAGSEVFLRGL